MDKDPKELNQPIIEEERPGGQAPAGPPDPAPAPGGPNVFQPAVRSMWFLFFGLLLGPAIMFFGRDPDGSPLKWVALSLLFLGLILHRLSLTYVLTGGRLVARAWWGLGDEQAVTVAQIAEVRPMDSFVGRLVGCSHLEVRSAAPEEAGLVLMGQPDGWRLARRLEDLAREARSRPTDAEQSPCGPD